MIDARGWLQPMRYAVPRPCHNLLRGVANVFLNGVLVIAATAAIASAQGLTTVRVASRLSRPLFATHAPEDPTRLYIVEQHTGRIKVLNLDSGVVNTSPFLDIDNLATGNEQGLLGLAFHPDFSENRRFFVNFTERSGTTRIVEYTATSPDVADPASARELLNYSQPFSNHNGGWLGFGPKDNLLYISSGDGGGAGDQGNRAQNLNTRLGKMLRIDVDGNSHGAYGVPLSNPFHSGADDTNRADDEIWAYGLRNPWRPSFDRETGDLYIADVGQDAIEEIDFQPANSSGGENYGWKVMEGTRCFSRDPRNPPCNDPSLVLPIHEYRHTGAPNGGFSVTGGYVYRGPIESLHGTYFFADFVTEQIWSLRYDGTQVSEFANRTQELAPEVGSIDQISSFGEDLAGNLYIVDLGGEIYKLIARELLGDYDDNGVLDANDVTLLITAIVSDPTNARFDADGNGTLDRADLNVWVHDFRRTWLGDANLDGQFNSGDLVQVFQAGMYETGMPANWAAGDWTADGLFNTGDLVAAFQDGGFEKGPRAAVASVPEPGGVVTLVLALVVGLSLCRRW